MLLFWASPAEEIVIIVELIMSSYINQASNQNILYLIVFVFCTIVSDPVFAVPPSLDLDADDSRVHGIGFYNSYSICDCGVNQDGGPLPIVDNDVQITDIDSPGITSIEVTIMNPHPFDALYVDDPLIPSSIWQFIGDTLYVNGSVVRAIRWANDEIMQNTCWSWVNCDDRLIGIKVRDGGGEWSNTTIATINPTSDPVVIRGIIYVTVRNALSTATLHGSVVSGGYEVGDIHVIETETEGYRTVYVSHPGYVPTSQDNVLASLSNDPNLPVIINLCNTADADADVVPNGLIDAGDYLVATQVALGLKNESLEERCHGDINGDGNINLPDLIGILQAILGAP